MNRYDQLLANKPLTWLRQGQFLLALIIYTTLLLIPDPQLAGPDLSAFYLHALGNTLLMLSTWVASGGRYRSIGPLIFVVLFSMIIELAQGLTDNRTPELIDVYANLAGTGIGFILCMILDKIADTLRRQSAK